MASLELKFTILPAMKSDRRSSLDFTLDLENVPGSVRKLPSQRWTIRTLARSPLSAISWIEVNFGEYTCSASIALNVRH